MGKKKTCPKCGLEFEVSKKDAMLRKAVSLQAKMFPAMKEYAEAAKDYCNLCWKKTVTPAAKGILGAMAEEESKKEGSAKVVKE